MKPKTFQRKGMLSRGKCDNCRTVFFWGKELHITETNCPQCGRQLKKHCWERKIDQKYKLYSIRDIQKIKKEVTP